MTLETVGIFRILTPKLGHILHDKKNDIYSKKVYLGKYATIDDYEEVLRDDIDIELYQAFEKVQQQVTNLEQDTDLLGIFNEIINE